MSKLKHKFDEVDSVILGSGHSMILGHKPQALALKDVGKKLALEKQDIDSFGLFDNATPNYANYYPDVTAEDLQPKDDEFIYPVFRLLSETIVHKTFNPIDFSEKGVLKKSMKKLIGQSINIDHETAIGNAIGSVKEVEWGESYTTKNGIVIPAGINGTFKIDGKSNPRIARGILMDPPSIHSNSVTVRFKWEKSHNMKDGEFMYKIGTYGEDGELIRRIVTDIVSYNETSLVAHGADPYAQILNDEGEINNPEHANKVYSFSFDDGTKRSLTKYSVIDYKDLYTGKAEDTVKNSIPEEDINKQNTNQMKQLIAQLASVISLEEGVELTEENLAEVVKSTIEGKDQEIADLTASKEGMVDKASFDNEVAEKEQLQSKLDSILEDERAEAIRVYSLAHGDCPESISKVIEAGDSDTVAQFTKDAEAVLNEKNPLKCNSCGSIELSRRSSEEGNDGEDGGDADERKEGDVISNSEAKASLMEKKKNRTFFNRLGEDK